MSIRIADIHRYPVKGLSPEKLGSAVLSKGGYFPATVFMLWKTDPRASTPGGHSISPKSNS